MAALEQVLEYPQVIEALGSLGYPLAEVYAKLQDLATDILMGYTTRVGKKRWVDKTPNYYKLLPFIERLFNERALYIVLVRHPLDCIASLEQQFIPSANHEDPDIANMFHTYGAGRHAWAHYWIDVYQRALSLLALAPSRSFVLRYEDLVTTTDKCLRQLFAFLGESVEFYHPDRAFSMRHTPGYQDSKILKTTQVHTSSIGRWCNWSERVPAVVEG